MAQKMKIKKGDEIIVLTGKDKGKKGTISSVFPKENRVVVAGINVAKRHTKPSAAGAGGIVNKELSIHASNVALVDPKSGKPTRVGYKTLSDGKKVRVAKRSGETLNA